MPTLWAGNRRRQRTHHCIVVDGNATVPLSAIVSNDETPLVEPIATVIGLDSEAAICCGTDLAEGGAAVLIALLATHWQQP